MVLILSWRLSLKVAFQDPVAITVLRTGCSTQKVSPKFAAHLDIQTSCLTEILFEQAQERARELDSLRVKGQLAGPLHGLPISLKDSFQVKGTEATLGFVAYLDRGPSQENSCLVDVLLAQGAVLYCKTNVPQTLMVG